MLPWASSFEGRIAAIVLTRGLEKERSSGRKSPLSHDLLKEDRWIGNVQALFDAADKAHLLHSFQEAAEVFRAHPDDLVDFMSFELHLMR